MSDDGSEPAVEDDGAQHAVHLLVRRRRVNGNQGPGVDWLGIHCPVDRLVYSVDHCARCPRYQGLFLGGQGASLECRLPGAPARIEPLTGPAMTQSIAEAMQPELGCFDPECDANRAAKQMEIDGVASAPVVDDRGVLLGVVSARALAQPRGGSEVEDAMSTEPITLPQTASVADAIDLMARTGLDRIPVVTSGNVVVGTVSSMDLVRWLARTR